MSELTLILPLQAGGADKLRAAFEKVGPRLSENANSVGTLHDMRWVIFDNDSRVLLATTYDGDWDAYIDDFVGKVGTGLGALFTLVEGFPANPTTEQVKDWLAQHQITAASWFCAYPDATVRDIWKSQKVLRAFNTLLDAAAS